MATILCLGELLIDFMPAPEGVPIEEGLPMEGGRPMEEVGAFIKAPGGAPANVAVGLARLGFDAGFLGKVGDDPFGRYLSGVLETNRVDVTGLKFTKEAQTSLAFVSLGKDGERSFLFYRNPGADTLLAPSEISRELLRGARCLHFGSLTLVREPARSATREAARIARDEGLILSFDPNVRPALWPSRREIKEQTEWALREADILKMSEEDLPFLLDTEDVEEAISRIMQRFEPDLLIITLGRRGCLGIHKEGREYVEGLAVSSIDTTGAGDAFTAGLLSALFREDTGIPLSGLTSTRLRRVLRFANACGAIATTKKGAIPALPREEEVSDLL